jgi:hypothetical protein
MIITIGDVFDAMEKDGYPKLTNGDYINITDDGEILACAYGQAGINLGISPRFLHGKLTAYDDIYHHVIADNDRSDLSVSEIARKYRRSRPSLLKDEFEVPDYALMPEIVEEKAQL